MATTNASADDLTVALKPLTISLSDSELEFFLNAMCQVANGKLGTDYTKANEPEYVKIAIIYYAVEDIIINIFFDENIDTVRWRFNDVEIQHGQNAFAIRDMATKKRQFADFMLNIKGINVKSRVSYNDYQTAMAGRPDGYYYGVESTGVENV